MYTFLVAFALAAPPEILGRDLHGRPVTMPEPGSVVVLWERSCESCADEIRDALSAGAPVITVNTDPAQDRALIEPWLHARGLSVTTLADPAGDLRGRISLLQLEAIAMGGRRPRLASDAVGVTRIVRHPQGRAPLCSPL